jgi:hypothetical protein
MENKKELHPMSPNSLDAAPTLLNLGGLFKALCAAQKEMKTAKKTSSNPYFKSSYSDLAEVWQTIQGPLTKNGLCVTQVFDHEGDKIILVTRLCHIDGAFIESRLPLILTKCAFQVKMMMAMQPAAKTRPSHLFR